MVELDKGVSMKKEKKIEVDDEYLAKVDSLVDERDKLLEYHEKADADIRKLVALLVENGIPIPEQIARRYEIVCGMEKLPFD